MNIVFFNSFDKNTHQFLLPKIKSDFARIYSRICNISIDSSLNISHSRIRNIYLNILEIFRDLVNFSDRLLSKKTKNHSIHSLNYCNKLSRNSKKIEKTYSLGKKLIFETMQGGIVNPPVLVFKEGEKTPIGVFKAENGNESAANIRLKALESLKSKGFIHLPTIYKNVEGQHLTKIDNVFFYFMQFLSPDASPISFEQFLITTGDLHHYTKMIPYSNQLANAKLDEYKTRSHFFLDHWFSAYDSIFKDPLWNEIVDLSQYFLSSDFQKIYQNLPIQLIHGDNNQTNIIVSSQIPYFIDFDSLRFDVRLLDLASYFRYGGFDQYITLTKKNDLLPCVNATYGKNAGLLNVEEENHFHLVVAFSHIEFISWALKMLKKMYLEENKEKANELYQYILLYKKQLSKVMDILKKLEKPPSSK